VQSRRLTLAVGLLAVLLVGVACGVDSETTPVPDPSETPAATEPATGAPSTTASPGGSAGPVDLTVGLGYIPSVQFAPFRTGSTRTSSRSSARARSTWASATGRA
jgi:hypothetical protein